MIAHRSHSQARLIGKMEAKMLPESELASRASTCGPQEAARPADSLQSGNHPQTAESSSGLLKNVLISCVYIALRCSHCGDLRQVLAVLPASDEVPCPMCSRRCSFIPLGRGLTKSQIPFHELHRAEKQRLNFQTANENFSP